MLLSRITVDPATYQKRDTPYSEATVQSIERTGIILSKFDALPLLRLPNDICVVAGDGHSRFEAICRLKAKLNLPREWRTPEGDWDVPHKFVDPDEAKLLAWTGNLRGTSFTPCEEAKVYQEMLAEYGNDYERVAILTHAKSVDYIRKMVPLNGLSRDIREMVGRHPDAGGIEKFIAQKMAQKFQQYGIGHAQQQELWHKVLKHAELTDRLVTALIDKIGKDLASTSGGADAGFLFEIPATVTGAVQSMKGRAENQRRAERGLAWLMQCHAECPQILRDVFPELEALLALKGKQALAKVKRLAANDADLVGGLLAGATVRRAPAVAA